MSPAAASSRYDELRAAIPASLLTLETWPSVAESTLDADYLDRYKRLVKGADMFLKRQPMSQIVDIVKMSASQFLKLFQLALKPWPDGTEVVGTRAFVKFLVQKKRKRVSPRDPNSAPRGGYSGMFPRLLKGKPAVESDLIDFLNGKARPNSVKPKILHQKFLEICKTHDVAEEEYPFTTKSKGFRPLMKWFEQVYVPSYLLAHIGREHGKGAAVAAAYETGDGQSRTPPTPFLVWVIDEFTCDLETSVEIPSPRWDVEVVKLSRFPVLRCRSIGSVACNIAWHMCIREQASGADVIQLFRNAVLGQPEPPVVDPNMKMAPGAGFPTTIFAELRFAVPVNVYIDNALAHLLNDLQELLTRLYGGRVILGKPGTPKGRPDIESAIGHTVRALIHQLVGTSGTGPLDPTRKTAERPAEALVRIGHIEQVIHVQLANENVSESAGAGYLDSFTRLRHLVERKAIEPNYLPELKRKPHHFCAPKRKRILCDLRKGRLPHIDFLHRRYSSDWLKKQPFLRDREYWVLVDYHDLRTLVLCDDNMAAVAILTCEGEWGRVPHDLRILKIYGRRKADARFKTLPRDVPLFAVLAFLAQEAPKESSAALDYAYIMRYLKRHVPAAELAAIQAGQAAHIQWNDGVEDLAVNDAQVPVSATVNKVTGGVALPIIATTSLPKRRFNVPRNVQ